MFAQGARGLLGRATRPSRRDGTEGGVGVAGKRRRGTPSRVWVEPSERPERLDPEFWWCVPRVRQRRGESARGFAPRRTPRRGADERPERARSSARERIAIERNRAQEGSRVARLMRDANRK